MNYLFFSGASNIAKTHDLNALQTELLNNGFSTIIENRLPNRDFIAVLENNKGKKVLINSSSDNLTSLNQLRDFITNNCVNKFLIDTVISSLREDTESIRQDFLDYFSQHSYFLNSYKNRVVDIPMGRPRTGSVRLASCLFLTETTINLTIHILSLPPFLLI